MHTMSAECKLYQGQLLYWNFKLLLQTSRGVSSFLKLGGEVVMRRAATAAATASITDKNWVDNCPSCPPASYAPE